MKIGILGCKGSTLDLINTIISEKSFSLDAVITLPIELACKNKVAFYTGDKIVQYCQKNMIPYYVTKSYNLKDEEDLIFFKKNNFDILLVIGWERLIPNEILQTLGKFACGMHGSPYGLPKGRGRSPLNWSIITNQNKFITYLFKYNNDIDAGDLIGFKVFDINLFDTISSLHAKNRIVMYKLLCTYLPLIEQDKIIFFPQPPEKPSFYPKRAPEDGIIDFNQNTIDIYNLIRATSYPYPSAYCFYNDKKVYIREAYPFDSSLYHSEVKPGTIVDLSISLKEFVFKTSDGSIIVRKFDGIDIDEFKLGDMLTGANYNKILQKIINRYPKGIENDEREI